MADPINRSARQFTAHSQDLARLMLTIGENRLALLKLEAAEERERFLRSIVMGAGAGAFVLLSCMTLSAAIVVWCWNSSPVAVLLTLTGFYGAAGVWTFRCLRRLLQDHKTFSASFDQIEKDACLFGRNSGRDPSGQRKHVLIAESERNRIQLAREMEALRAEAAALTNRAKSFGSITASAVELTANLAAFRRGKTDDTGTRPAWLPVILKGAGVISSLFLAFRSRRHDHDTPVSPTTNRTSTL